MQNLAIDYLRQTVRRHPQKTAIVDGDHSITFAELWSHALSLAESIMAQGGADVIVVPIAKSIAAIVAYAAAQLCGSVYVPLDPATPSRRRQRMLTKLGPHAVLDYVDGQFRWNDVGCPIRTRPVDCELVERDLFRRLASRGGYDPLYVMFTSGTTGTPKGVTISNLAVIDYIDWAIESYAIDEQERIGNSVPLFFDASVLDLYTTFARGCTLHLIPAVGMRFPADLVGYLQQHEISLFFCVPSALMPVVKLDQLAEMPLPALRKVLFIGESLPPSTVRYLQHRLPHALISNQYGPTEITVTATFWHVPESTDELREVPIGQPCANTYLVLLDERQQTVAACDEVGEIAVGGLGVALGYWNEPELTKGRFIQNPAHHHYRDLIYRTGDLGYRAAKDGLYYLVGRKDHQFKHLGHRIEAGEIESAIRALAEVHQCVCHYDDQRQQIVAFVQARQPVSVRDLKQRLAESLPSYMLPRRVENVVEFPLTANGKIDRQAVWEASFESSGSLPTMSH